MQTIQQKMAACAWRQTSAKQPISREYKTQALKLPGLIQSCGLSQALSFVVAQEKELIADLQQVLEAAGETFDGKGLCARAREEANLLDYLRLSRRALDGAGWIKRYVQALTKDEDSGEPS